MERSHPTDRIKHVTYVILGLLSGLGTFWAFQRGGGDYFVFEHAARLILESKVSLLYQDSPDRYLYAPGFAWLFVPFALLPKAFGLFLWCALKTAAVLVCAKRIFKQTQSWAAVLAGFLLFSRFLLIDFQYGQLNFFILTAIVWALFGEKSKRELFLSWLCVGVLSFSKPLTLLIGFVPLASYRKKSHPNTALLGMSLGALGIFILPMIFRGFTEGWNLHLLWLQALELKSIPLESHNQSFAATMSRYFTGQLVHVISLGSTWIPFGVRWMTPDQVKGFSFLWSASAMLFFVGLTIRFIKTPRFEIGALLLSALILPSHLIWKTYFIFGIPLGAALFSKMKRSVFSALVLALNFSGFDWLGPGLGGWLEAASFLFWLYVGLVLFSVRLFFR